MAKAAKVLTPAQNEEELRMQRGEGGSSADAEKERVKAARAEELGEGSVGSFRSFGKNCADIAWRFSLLQHLCLLRAA
jgi:hypothetical protein